MISSCMEAVHWACRLLPFSRFLNAEEMLQDVLLSLVSELPPLSMVSTSPPCPGITLQCMTLSQPTVTHMRII